MGGWAALMDTIWGGRYLIGYWFVGGVYMVNIDYGGVGSANGYYMERAGYGCG